MGRSGEVNVVVQLGLLSAGFAGYIPAAAAFGFVLQKSDAPTAFKLWQGRIV